MLRIRIRCVSQRPEKNRSSATIALPATIPLTRERGRVLACVRAYVRMQGPEKMTQRARTPFYLCVLRRPWTLTLLFYANDLCRHSEKCWEFR